MTEESHENEASKLFAKWLEDGPKLAKAAGLFVEITVTTKI